MKNTFTKKLLSLGVGVLAAAGALNAQAFTENFDNISLLAGNGWSLQNLSGPLGVTNWFQGTNVAAGGPFDAYNGAANAYIGANYNNTTGGSGIISNWLMTPNRTFRNGDVFTFYTRKVAPDAYADRLEVRMSTNGASTNAGSTSTSVGDFTTLLVSVNPNLILGSYPTVWTQYTITISGLTAPTSGRIAFRYFVTSAGPSGANSDYIGIDAVQYTPYVCPAFTVNPSSFPNGTAGTAYSQSMTSSGPLGAPSYAVTAGSLPPGLTLSAAGTISGTPTATGTFSFTVTVSDASGCTGTLAGSIMIVCPTNGATLSSFPPQCSNAAPYMLTQGSPAGGTYSGTGVSGGMFNPSAGTQTITYTLIDAYGCTQTATGTMTVNTAPTVTLASFSAVCSNAGMIALGGGSPAGGAYSGNNVSGGMFDPMGGTQVIDYTYTDGNGCTNTSSQSFPVNMAPSVSVQSFAPVCDNSGMVMLNGESPAGGTWSGTGVSGNQFDPMSGTQTVTYSYTDGNGCTETASATITVNMAPNVTLSLPMDTICQSVGTITLSGESPAGGTWSGPGVSGNQFDPNAAGLGFAVIEYMYTGANGCMNTGMDSMLVDICLGVTAPVNGTSLVLFPNPANGNVTISTSAGNSIVRIMNMNGQVMESVFTTTNMITVNLAGFAAGVYVVEVEHNGATSHQRLIVQ